MSHLIVFFMLFESFYCISLKTDPIHREDYRGAVAYMQQEGHRFRDAMLDVEPEINYYWLSTDVPRNCVNMCDFDDTKKYERVFIMSNYSMMEANNAKDLKAYQDKLQGFHKTNMVKFGGENGHTVVYVFEKNT